MLKESFTVDIIASVGFKKHLLNSVFCWRKITRYKRQKSCSPKIL